MMQEEIYNLLYKLTGEHQYSTMIAEQITEDAGVLARAAELKEFSLREVVPAGGNKADADRAAKALKAAGWTDYMGNTNGARAMRWRRVTISIDDRRAFRAWCMEHRRRGFTTDDAMQATLGHTNARKWAVAEIRSLGIKTFTTPDGRLWKAPVLRPGDPEYQTVLDNVINRSALLIAEGFRESMKKKD